jgi:hydrogenase expression/formation protein HypC
LTPPGGFASLARVARGVPRGEVLEMCLAVPMRIKSVDGFEAVCEAKGIERSISLFMLQGEPLAPGDHVLVHVGYAIQKVSEEEARLTWELFDEIIEHA